MKIVIPKVSCKYGAPMGRMSASDVVGKCKLQRMNMSSCGCYDESGAYWGCGDPMFVCEDADGDHIYLRASSRKDAKQQLIEKFPYISFYR